MSLRRFAPAITAAALAVAVGAGTLSAATPKNRRAEPAGVNRTNRIATTDISRRIDVNQINMFVTNIGSFAFNLSAGDAGLFYPKGTDRSAVFASGLWLGARAGADPVPRVTVAEYSQEYGPGAMQSLSTWDNPADPANIVYKVVRYTGDPQDTARVERTPNELAFEDPLVHHSWSEYMAGAVPKGAPWRMYRLPDTSTPAPGDSVDVPGPDVLGDMMLWAVYNDADPGNHTNSAGASLPLGVEVQQTTFAFNRQGALGLTVFIKYKFINKSGLTLSDMFVSQWSDPDLGGAAGFTDDLVGTDTLPDGTGKPRSLGYVYNSTNNDGGYGSRPPALGYDFFQGPSVGGTPLPMTSFNKYINGTDPASPDESYAYMQGLDPHGDPIVDPFGNVTRFQVAGDPVSPGPGDWLDAVPADRRMMLSSGPFTMAPGDTQEVVVGIVIGQGNDRLSSISALRFNDEFAQDAFDKDFDLPSPPSQPNVAVSVDHQEVVLSWDARARTSYDEPGYTFEGYNVYQGASVSGPWTRIATYDEINGTRVIFDRVFDVESGQLIPEYPVAFGSDAGVRHSITITQDAIRGGPLRDGTEYYFAVTSYAYDPDGLPKVLENAQEVVTAVPGRPAAGTDLGSASATPVTYLRIDPNRSPATDVVSVEVVNPELVTGHVYKVTFEPTVPLFSGTVGSDTATVAYSWTVTDSTTGEVKATGQLNRRGDDDYLVIDGLRIRVAGRYFPQFQEANYLDLNPAHRRALTGVNFGLPSFFGGAGAGFDFFGGTINPVDHPDSFATVQLQFDQNRTQRGYRFFRVELPDGGIPTAYPDRGYVYGGFHEVPFQVWDIVNDRQLDFAWVERMVTDNNGVPDATQPATHDSSWGPDASDVGGREYAFVIGRPYSDTPKTAIAQDGAIVSGTLPLMWVLWSRLRADTDVIDDGDAFEWTWANPATPNDVYVFDTQELQRGNTALAASNLSRIRAVPNPYYTRSTYELNQFQRRLKFINLPENCTIRIFSLAGHLVRTLRKTSAASSQFEWDLETENGLPIGSGVYIFHVEAPGVGDYTSRVVVFMEKERLNSY